MTSRELGRIVERWERGEPIDAEELARIERLREESPQDFERVALLLPLMRREIGERLRFDAEVPDIAGRVIEQIEHQSAKGATTGEEVAGLAARRGPRRGLVPARWLLQAAAALLLLGIGVVAGVTISTRTRELAGIIVVRFELDDPQAKTVAVVGDFNDWQPETMAMHKRSGMWEITIPLRRGDVYTYNFLIDGRSWIPDPTSLYRVHDGFGGEKSVLQL